MSYDTLVANERYVIYFFLPPFTIGLSKSAVMSAVTCVCGKLKLQLAKLS